MAANCNDTNLSVSHLLDASSTKNSLVPIAVQISGPTNASQLFTLSQLRPQQGILPQPSIQISNLQQLQHQHLQQQLLQQQLLKGGQSPQLGSVVPQGQQLQQLLQQHYSALQYQLLLQALQQQNLLHVPTSSSSLTIPIANALRTSTPCSGSLPTSFKLNVPFLSSLISSTSSQLLQQPPKMNGTTFAGTQGSSSSLPIVQNTVVPQLISQDSSTSVATIQTQPPLPHPCPFGSPSTVFTSQQAIKLTSSIITASQNQNTAQEVNTCPMMSRVIETIHNCYENRTTSPMQMPKNPSLLSTIALPNSPSSGEVMTSSAVICPVVAHAVHSTLNDFIMPSDPLSTTSSVKYPMLSQDRAYSLPNTLENNLCMTSGETWSTKPDILTHIIEGFIIHEGPEPFPIPRSVYINEFLDSEHEDSDVVTDEDEIVEQDKNDANSFKIKQKMKHIGSSERRQCQYCSIFFDPTNSISRAGKFCSLTCSKKIAACSRWMIHFASKGVLSEKNKHKKIVTHRKKFEKISGATNADAGISDKIEADEEKLGSKTVFTLPNVKSSSILHPEVLMPNNPSNVTPKSPLRGDASQENIDSRSSCLNISGAENIVPSDCDASQWGVTEVYNFIQSLPGCGMYAEDFKKQEIDGQALLLLTEEHLMTTMNIKLGPALKICSNIRNLRENAVSKNAAN